MTIAGAPAWFCSSPGPQLMPCRRYSVLRSSRATWRFTTVVRKCWSSCRFRAGLPGLEPGGTALSGPAGRGHAGRAVGAGDTQNAPVPAVYVTDPYMEVYGARRTAEEDTLPS